MAKNPFTTFKNNYAGTPTEDDIGPTIEDLIARHYKSLQNDIIVEMNTGKKDVAYGTFAKQTQILKQISQRLDEFNGTAGAELMTAMKEAAAYQTKLAIDDMTLMGMDIKKPEEWHADYNDDYVKKAFGDTYEHIAGQTGRMLTTAKMELRTDSRKIFRRAAVEGWTRKKAHKELMGEMLKADPSFKFTDKSGRQWDTSTYFDMLTKTVMKTAQNEAYANTLINEGQDLVKVNHNGAKDECKNWEGKILSLTGATPGYLTVDYATSTGEVFHPRCKHRLLAYNPEIDAVFDLIDAGVGAKKIMGDTKKGIRELVAKVPLKANQTDLVAARFHNPEHQAKYLEYVEQSRHDLGEIEDMMRQGNNKSFKDVYEQYKDGGRNNDYNAWQTYFANPMKSLIKKHCGDVFYGVDSWQGSTHTDAAMTLKMLHAMHEGNVKDIIWKKEKWDTKEEIAEKNRRTMERAGSADMADQYIRLRALNQVYMEKIGLTEIELMRGTGGPEGRGYAKTARDNPDMDIFKMRDANIAGYTTAKYISDGFGLSDGGITVTRTFKRQDIIINRDLMCGVTGSHLREEEYIVTGGKIAVPINKMNYPNKPQKPEAAEAPIKTKTVTTQQSAWLLEIIADGEVLPTKDEADELYEMGAINKADKDALYAYVSM